MNKERLTIIIPTHNRIGNLYNLLLDIRQLDIPVGISINTVVVNDGSTDGTTHLLNTKFTDVTQIFGNGNWWWTKSINQGLKSYPESDFFLLLNDDNRIEKDYLTNLFNAYYSVGTDCIMGSSSVSIELSGQVDVSGSKRFNKLLCKSIDYVKASYTIDETFTGVHSSSILSGRGMLFSKYTVQKNGFFDETLVQYGSDYDFTLRAVKVKIPVFISWDSRVKNLTTVTSKSRNSSKISILFLFQEFFNPYSSHSLKKFWIFYKRHCYPVFTPFFIFYIILTETVIVIYKKMKNQY